MTIGRRLAAENLTDGHVETVGNFKIKSLYHLL